METIFTTYKQKAIPQLKSEFALKNVFEIPRITKVSINVGVGKSQKDANFLDTVENTLRVISGQKPIRTKAKKSIAGFKIREGIVVGMCVTLRGKRMYDFLEKLVKVALPRVRDFRGLDPKSVDDHGNFTIGFKESIAFPEIKADEIERIHGLEITIATTAGSKEKGLALLKALGFPFKVN